MSFERHARHPIADLPHAHEIARTLIETQHWHPTPDVHPHDFDLATIAASIQTEAHPAGESLIDVVDFFRNPGNLGHFERFAQELVDYRADNLISREEALSRCNAIQQTLQQMLAIVELARQKALLEHPKHRHGEIHAIHDDVASVIRDTHQKVVLAATPILATNDNLPQEFRKAARR